MYTLSPHGVIDSWNAGAERLYGYTASEVIGQSHELLFTADDRAVAMPARVLEAAGATGRSSADRWQAKKDGTTFYANRVTFVLAGPRQGFATIARDLTAQRDADRAVERARGELEHRVHERTIALQAEVTQRASAQERVTALLRRVVTAQEDERARVSRELHDQLGQQLTALRLTLDRHRSACALAATSDDIDRALAATGEIDRVVDFLAWELRPAILDHLGLASALRRFLDEWSSRYGITTKFEAVGMDKGRLSPETEIAFYRVAQEALNNVAKHAHHATRGP
jgi:PAS domain S-box-containing protein